VKSLQIGKNNKTIEVIELLDDFTKKRIQKIMDDYTERKFQNTFKTKLN
jgi:hypothetical protein